MEKLLDNASIPFVIVFEESDEDDAVGSQQAEYEEERDSLDEEEHTGSGANHGYLIQH